MTAPLPTDVHTDEFTYSMRQGHGVRLHVAEAGSGPMVLFMHGFPEFWYTWRHQMRHLKDRYHVVAPDLRGYNFSEKPSAVSAYRTGEICDDMVALIRGYGKERATIVAHDWGGAVAWLLAVRNPEVVEKLVIMNAPHPKDFQKLIFANLKQLQMSWYIFFFQLPGLPEAFMSRKGYRPIREIFKDSAANKEAFTKEDLDAFQRAMSQPGALTAALNYYRAGGRNLLNGFGVSGQETKSKPASSIQAPTLVIWGTKDKALSLACTDGMADRVSGPFRLVTIEESGHWVQNEAPQRVNELLDEFLAE